MATISLRNYLREIEILIDQGKHEEAVKHCKHILKFFPKNIDTYRLLGKAYLENQHYSEAGDIFQRVLSVLPDDFVAQIGMSIIREDEGNLDAAIWHIERAFEVQPANAAIQDEIRRLYGRRDGVHLSKIRLSRGALIRMYLQGELYNQAISETRTALAEDPQRIDLEVLLARLYYLSGKKVEAAETCSQILNKLPFCLEANKILSVILSSLDRSEEARVFQQRIYSLEPYAAHITKNAPAISQVPDNVVTLERLDLDDEMGPVSEQPDWAQTIGIQIDQHHSEDILPDWLPSLTKEHLIDQGEEHPLSNLNDLSTEEMDLESLELGDDTDIPEWMKSAGWAQSQKKQEVIPDEQLQGEEDIESTPAEDIPDWLKDIAPTEMVQTPLEETLDDVPAGEPFTEIFADEKNAETEGVPGDQFSGEDLEPTDDISAWLKTLDDTAKEVEYKPLESTFENDQEQYTETPAFEITDIPTIGEETESDKKQGGFEEIDEAMQWLESIADEHTTEGDSNIVAGDKPEKPDEWVKEYEDLEEPDLTDTLILDETPEDNISASLTTPVMDEQTENLLADDLTMGNLPAAAPALDQGIPTDLDDGFAWLESLAAKQGADEATLTTQTGERKAEIPDWLSSYTDEQAHPIEEDAVTTATEPELEISQAVSESGLLQDDTFTDLDDEFNRTIEKYGEIEEIETQEIETQETIEKVVPFEAIETQKGLPHEASKAAEEKDPAFAETYQALMKNDLTNALQQYNVYIQNGEHLEEIIDSVQEALLAHPVDAQLWQILGDAYAKDNKLQQALEAYTKAEELLY